MFVHDLLASLIGPLPKVPGHPYWGKQKGFGRLSAHQAAVSRQAVLGASLSCARTCSALIDVS
jgi:hypothetical protein